MSTHTSAQPCMRAPCLLGLALCFALPVAHAAALTAPASFTEQGAVLSALDRAIAACSDAGAADCRSTCETSRRLAASHLAKTKVNTVAVENQWRSCERAHAAAFKAVPAAVDVGSWAINGFAIGADLRTQQERFQMLQARGYVRQLRADNTVRLRFNATPESGAAVPDVVLHYSGIVEQGGFTTVEAAGDGRIYRIRHVVKGAPDAGALRAELKKQYGEPHEVQGDMWMWGCKPSNLHNCFIVEIMPHQVEYRAVDERIKTDWAPKYEAALAAARS